MAGKTVGELEDELKRKDERIAELRQEIDEQRDLIRRFEEAQEDFVSARGRTRPRPAQGSQRTWPSAGITQQRC